jgi:hypothetical protein
MYAHPIQMTLTPGSSPLSALDLQEFIPASIKPEFAGAMRAWYIKTYNDQLFINGPPFIHAYFLVELFYTLPMNIWGVWALGKRQFRARDPWTRY